MEPSNESLVADEKTEEQDFIGTTLSHVTPLPFLCNYKGFWLTKTILTNVERLGGSFAHRPDDLFIASYPKCGTTWLKALAFAARNRTNYSPLTSISHPLLTLSPHECVPFLDVTFGGMDISYIESMPSPRLLSFHLTPSLLPTLFANASSNHRIIYVCRDPKDAFTSLWQFQQALHGSNGMKSFLLDDTFEYFCHGMVPYGPIWEHVLEYWSESQRQPNKVLFLRYEEMIEDPRKIIKMVAQFMGCEFSKEEENTGLVDELVRLCSFNSLSNVEENKHGELIYDNLNHKKSFFFRKGQVGDWANLLTPEMGQRLDKITQEKVKKYGLNF